jgi:hypothetical protein
MAVRSMKVQAYSSKTADVEPESTVAMQAESVVFLPGRASRSVVVTMAFAQATVLRESLKKS